ncbi:hypothetical protein [Arthrobacter sp. CG_A4]|uniref:hypothetical protein n=1 Tax=Arthrobacter sp. CG_A4 TaxID=3071706 RepID=UPI002DFFAE7B|nr:hypothetical protein [Arthrobacter sp. CG_A4]
MVLTTLKWALWRRDPRGIHDRAVKNECVRKGGPFMTGTLTQLADGEKATMALVR